MKPFDLEAAKRGEPICTSDGTPLIYVGLTSSGGVVVEYCDDGGVVTASDPSVLRMASKKRTVWVNFYVDGRTCDYRTQKCADAACAEWKIASSALKDRIGCKAYPVEIDE